MRKILISIIRCIAYLDTNSQLPAIVAETYAGVEAERISVAQPFLPGLIG